MGNGESERVRWCGASNRGYGYLTYEIGGFLPTFHAVHFSGTRVGHELTSSLATFSMKTGRSTRGMRRHSSSSLLLLMLVPEASCLLVRPGLHHLASPLPPKLLQTTPVSFAARSSSICLAEGSGSSGEGQAERVDAILQKFGDAEGLPAAQKEGEQDEGEQEPFSFERELELFKEGKGETAEFLKEFLPTFAFFLAIRIAIVEPRYIPVSYTHLTLPTKA